MAALTLVLMTLSSRYWPVPSFCYVDVQPTTETRVAARKTAERYLAWEFVHRDSFN